MSEQNPPYEPPEVEQLDIDSEALDTSPGVSLA